MLPIEVGNIIIHESNSSLAEKLTERDVSFYDCVLKKRNLSEAQSEYLDDLNLKIVTGMDRPPHCGCGRAGIPKVSSGGEVFFSLCVPSVDPSGRYPHKFIASGWKNRHKR